MFVETYYDEKAAIPASADEPAIPYPELVGEELNLWQKYLPVKRDVGTLQYWFYPPPYLARAATEKAKETRLFDRIEVWSRSDPDPMVVGISSLYGDKTRYYAVVRWGDAAITLEQVKKRLRLDQLLNRIVPIATTLLLMGVTLLCVLHG